MSTETKLQGVVSSKAAIKTAIEAKGVTVGDATFAQYAGKIADIQTGSAPATSKYYLIVHEYGDETKIPIVAGQTVTLPTGRNYTEKTTVNLEWHPALTFHSWASPLVITTTDGVQTVTIPSLIVCNIHIGALYSTDGSDYIVVCVHTYNSADLKTSLNIGASGDGTTTIDWGDTQTTTFTTTDVACQEHTYTTAGVYRIKVTCTSGRVSKYSASSTTNGFSTFPNTINKVFCEGNTILLDWCFNSYKSISEVVVPCVADYNVSRLCRGSSLKRIHHKYSVMQDYLCQGLAYLEYLILPIYGQINTATASSCVRIKELFIPEGYTTIYAGFQSLEGVEIIVIPTTVTSMWYNVFTNSYNLKVIIMQTATPPTITGASVFAGLHPSARIYVPVGSLAAYQAATNWSGLTIPILEMTEENKSKYSDEW